MFCFSRRQADSPGIYICDVLMDNDDDPEPTDPILVCGREALIALRDMIEAELKKPE